MHGTNSFNCQIRTIKNLIHRFGKYRFFIHVCVNLYQYGNIRKTKLRATYRSLVSGLKYQSQLLFLLADSTFISYSYAVDFTNAYG